MNVSRWLRLTPSNGLRPHFLMAGATVVAAWLVCFRVPTMAQQSTAARAYTLTPVTYGMELKTPDGRVIFDYMTKKPEDVALTSPSVACFHPVNSPSGERVSALAPDDHPHHRGMYLAWQDAEFRQPIPPPTTPTGAAFGWNITRADFWGWGVYAPRDGRVIQNTGVKLLGADANQARLEIRNDWTVAGSPTARPRKMLDEVTEASVAERDGVYVIDLRFRLTALVDYYIAKQAFSGFNFQARKDGQSYYTNSAGTVTLRDPHYSTPELNWPPAPWYGYVITLGNGKTVGVAVLDHPSNPPSTWHNSRGLWMLNPNIAAIAPVVIKVDQPLTLRYRVVVHDGPTPASVVDKLSTEWRASQ
jgi:hypothetical protein